MHVSVLKLLKYSYDGVLAGNCQYRQQWAWRWNFLETGEEPTTKITKLFQPRVPISFQCGIHLISNNSAEFSFVLSWRMFCASPLSCVVLWLLTAWFIFMAWCCVWSVPEMWDLIPGWHWGCTGLLTMTRTQ